MKIINVILGIISLVILSCGFNEDDTNSIAKSSNKLDVETKTNQKFYPIQDSNGNLIGGYFFPSNWVFKNSFNPEFFKDGAKELTSVRFHSTKSINYFDEGSNKRLAKEEGSITPSDVVNKIINRDLKPIARLKNKKLVKHYSFPELSIYKSNYTKLFINYQELDVHKTIITEWESDKGFSTILIINFQQSKNDHYSYGSYCIYEMNSKTENFQDAKYQFINSVLNFNTCYEYVYNNNLTEIRKITKNRTAQYFTPEQKIERRNSISKEEERTGTYEHKTFEEYIELLKSRGIITNKDSLEICNKFYLKEKQNRIDEYLRTDEEEYDPNINNNVNIQNWTQIEDNNN